MLPHNFARHALLPFDMNALQDARKVAYMADAVHRLGGECLYLPGDIVGICTAEREDLRSKLWGDADLIVDTTASPTVTEALSLPSVFPRPRAAETSLMAAGRMAVFAIEGPNSNPSLLDLQAESFQIMASTDAMAGLAFSEDGKAVPTGQGCAAITSPMTDATLSSMAAPLAIRIGGLLEDGLPPRGEIAIGTAASDGLGQTWLRHDVAGFQHSETDVDGPRVHVSSRVVDIIDAAIAKRPGVETGGVIVGRYSDTNDQFTIVDVIEAPPDSTYSSNEFVLGTNGLGKAIDAIVSTTGGALYPLGTWHNHLAESGPSPKDRLTGRALADAQSYPALLLIRTPSGFRSLVVERTDFPWLT